MSLLRLLLLLLSDDAVWRLTNEVAIARLTDQDLRDAVQEQWLQFVAVAVEVVVDWRRFAQAWRIVAAEAHKLSTVQTHISLAHKQEKKIEKEHTRAIFLRAH